MAILPGVPGIEVCVQCHGQDLLEYVDDGEWTHKKFGNVNEARRCSNYVQCETDAEFRIRLKLRHPFKIDTQSVTFKANVDGHGIAQATCAADYFERCSGHYMEVITSRLDRISPTECTSRALKFTSIKKVDDPDQARVSNDKKALDSIGEIVVSVFRTYQQDAYLPYPGRYSVGQHKPPAEVSEKALKGKAISHGVAYGEQHVITRPNKETFDVDGADKPIAVFMFKYRSKADLQAEMIIPRTPSPPPPPLRGRGAQTASFSREARLANLKREIEQIKSEKIDDVPRGQKRGNQGEASRSGRAYKTSRRQDGNVVIDLTND